MVQDALADEGTEFSLESPGCLLRNLDWWTINHLPGSKLRKQELLRTIDIWDINIYSVNPGLITPTNYWIWFG